VGLEKSEIGMPKSSQKGRGQILIGILVSLAVLSVLIYFVDWGEFITALNQADYSYLLPATLIYLFGLATRAKAWHTILGERPSLKQVFLTMNSGYLLNNTLPFRLGEFGRALLLGRRGLGFWHVFSTILIERAFDMVIALGLLLGTLPFVWRATQARQTAFLVAGIVLVGLVVLYLLAHNQERVLSSLNRIMARWPELSAKVGQRIRSFTTGLAALRDFNRFIRSLLWMTTTWLLTLSTQYLLLRAFIPESRFLWAAFILGVTAMGVALPSSPGYLGVYEAAIVGALTLFEVPFSKALAYALVSHIQYLLVTGIFGSYALIREGEALGGLYKRILQRTEA